MLELTLLDITPMMESLKGVVMELQDCALNLLKSNCLWVWLVIFFTYWHNYEKFASYFVYTKWQLMQNEEVLISWRNIHLNLARHRVPLNCCELRK